MMNLYILDELLSSDTCLFFAAGLIPALVPGMLRGWGKKGVIISSFILVTCEIGLHMTRSYMAGFVLLFMGTAALGWFAGSVIAMIINGMRK